MERTPPVFEAYGTSHFLVLALLPTLIFGLIFWKRSKKAPNGLRTIELLLAAGLLLSIPATALIAWQDDAFTLNNVLPFHLCDLAAIIGAWALIRPKQITAEFLYYWGIAGTTQGLLTPALAEGFPHPFFFVFFFVHIAIPAVALYLAIGKQLRPRPKSWLKVWIWTQLYLLFMFPFNLLAKTNYGYFREKPPTGSALDVLGPWPYYILAMEILALIFFFLLYLPFSRKRRSDR